MSLRKRPASSSVPSPQLSFANADLILRLHLDPSADEGSGDDYHSAPAFLDLGVSSTSLRRSRYFAALLSDRWCPSPSSSAAGRLSLVPYPFSCSHPFDAHVEVLKLLHTLDFAGAIRSPSAALDLLPVALQLLFEACIEACIRFLDAVPWSEDEEARVLDLAPLLPGDEAAELLARVSLPPAAAEGESTRSPSEAMLHGLIHSTIDGHPVPAATKAFIERMVDMRIANNAVKLWGDQPAPTADLQKLLNDADTWRNMAPGLPALVTGEPVVPRQVLDEAFLSRLETVKEFMGKYASPDFRFAVGLYERDETQKLNLHSAVLNVKHLLWLIERMVDMRIANNAVKLWGDQPALTADLQKLLSDADTWRYMAPGLPVLVIRCTLGLAKSAVTGESVVPRQARMKLAKSWLPVLNICRDIAQPMHSGSGYKSPNCQELEETFLQIISTLPLLDAQELLQQCLGFSTRNVVDCPHLVAAFKTWFRRAGRAPQDGEKN